MNYNTERVKKYIPKDGIDTELRKHFQEYYVLGVMKMFYPELLIGARLSERPDIQANRIGIEVTVWDIDEELQIKSDYYKYKHFRNNNLKLKIKLREKVDILFVICIIKRR